MHMFSCSHKPPPTGNAFSHPSAQKKAAIFRWPPFLYLSATLLRQFERYHVVTLLGAQRAVTAGHDQHVLLTVLAGVGHWCGLSACWQAAFPQLLAVANVVGAQVLVKRTAQERQTAGSGERTAQAASANRCPTCACALETVSIVRLSDLSC